MDVFFYEAFEEEVPALRRHLPSSWSAGFTSATIQESGDAAPRAPLISIRTQSVIPSSWCASLKGVLARTTGYDHLVAFRRAHPDAPPCGSLPKYCGQAVAEQAALLWMALLRRLPLQLDRFRRFQRDGLSGMECAGRALLVCGVGDIGGRIVRIGRGLGMDVRGVDPVQRIGDLTYVDLASGVARADVIVCAMNLTPGNRAIFRYESLKSAKPGALFVNVARGELSPPSDLLRLLNEGVLGGIALDVFDGEPALAASLRSGLPPASDAHRAIAELMKDDRVLLTPHNAFNTLEATERKSRETALQLERFRATGRFDPEING